MNWYFFGHHRCGTTWIRDILRELCPLIDSNYHVIGGDGIEFKNNPSRKNNFYCYVNATSENYKLVGNNLGFHLIRDPRDALISDYYSRKFSHSVTTQWQAELRSVLQQLSVEDGISHMLNMSDYRPGYLRPKDYTLTESPNVLDIRYEDMLKDDFVEFRKILDHLLAEINNETLKHILLNHSFESRVHRRPGQEDIHSHRRKAIAGDWMNYFGEDGPLKDVVYRKMEGVIKNLGYAFP
jgi:hypothetical protein